MGLILSLCGLEEIGGCCKTSSWSLKKESSLEIVLCSSVSSSNSGSRTTATVWKGKGLWLELSMVWVKGKIF